MVIYRCPDCGWEGSTYDLESELDELICPECSQIFPMTEDMFENNKWGIVGVEDVVEDDLGDF